MTGKHTPFHTADSQIYLADNVSGFSVRHCPDSEELATLIVRAVNAHDGLVEALENIARPLDCGCGPPTHRCDLAIEIDGLQDFARAALTAAKESAP